LLTSEGRTGTLPQTLSFVYNDDFQLTSFTYAGSTATLAYDNDGLVTQAGAFTIARNATTGFPESVSDATAVLVPSFNGYGEVGAQSVTVGGLPAMSWSVTRNDGGLITAKTETVGGTTDNYAYEYDTMGRLLEVEKGGIPVETYTYGANGQRLTETNTLRGITNRSYTYSLEDHMLSADAVTYAYDDDGFLTTKVSGLQTTTYAYSSRGELLEVDLPDNRVITYVHDPVGRRIAKKIDGIIVEKYLWAGMTQLLAVYDASNTLIMRFDGTRMTRSGSTYYLVTDQVGTVRAVVDTAGSIVKRIDYDSFGNILTDTNPTFTIPFGFAGGLHDRDTGLIRFGARDYDPDTGRWTAKDPHRLRRRRHQPLRLLRRQSGVHDRSGRADHLLACRYRWRSWGSLWRVRCLCGERAPMGLEYAVFSGCWWGSGRFLNNPVSWWFRCGSRSRVGYCRFCWKHRLSTCLWYGCG